MFFFGRERGPVGLQSWGKGSLGSNGGPHQWESTVGALINS